MTEMVFPAEETTTVEPTDSPSTTYTLAKDETTTPLSTSTQQGSTTVSPDIRRIRRERRKEMRKVSNSYETFYYQLNPETYTKMMSMAEKCATELEMDSEQVKNCTIKRIERRANRNKKDKRSKHIDGTNSTTDSTVTDDDEMSTTPSSTINEITIKEENKPKSWRDVVQFEQFSTRCYVDQMRKNDPFKKMTRKEWRDERDKMVLQHYRNKMNCLKQKLNLKM
jgi:hypothetical protein